MPWEAAGAAAVATSANARSRTIPDPRLTQTTAAAAKQHEVAGVWPELARRRGSGALRRRRRKPLRRLPQLRLQAAAAAATQASRSSHQRDGPTAESSLKMKTMSRRRRNPLPRRSRREMRQQAALWQRSLPPGRSGPCCQQ